VGRPTKYPDEFRRDAVALVRSSGRPIHEVAKSLGVHKSTLWNWCQLDKKQTTRAADPHALSESEAEELRRLRKEVVELRTDKEILKRAAAYFARETMR
jgi:transposase